METRQAPQRQPKAQRILKVREGFHSYQIKQPPRLRTEVAELLLKGHWLIQAGFGIGDNVTVNIEQGKLVIKTA